MTQRHHFIYVSESISNEEAQMMNDGLFAAGMRLCHRFPESLNDAGDLNGSGLVILDGASLGKRSIGIASRLRWLGFSGTLLLSADAESILDQAIARESGITDFIAPLFSGRALADKYRETSTV